MLPQKQFPLVSQGLFFLSPANLWGGGVIIEKHLNLISTAGKRALAGFRIWWFTMQIEAKLGIR